MRTYKIYLAGPISGLNWRQSENWRDEFKKITNYNNSSLIGYSPMRGKEYLRKEKVLGDHYDGKQFSSTKTIMLRDSHDVFTADGLLVNLTNAKKTSIGTVMEIAWAWQRRIPVVAIIEPDGSNIHEHAMLNEAIGFRVENVEDGVEVLEAIFNP